MPIKKDGKLARTPLDVQRSCTDCCCILIFAAALFGLGACIYIAYEKGDITRLESLPDYQGTQCVGKFIFFPQDEGGLNLHKQVCVDACPTANEPVTTILKPFETARRLQGGLVSATQGAGIAETDSLLFGSNPSPQVLTTTVGVGGGMEPTPEPATPAAPAAPMLQETTVVTTMAPAQGQVRLQGYPSVPVANVLCFPKVGEFQGQVMGIAGSNEFFEIALDINSLTSNAEVLWMAVALAVIIAFIFLCLVEYLGLFLMRLSVAFVVTAPAAIGVYFLALWYQDETSPIASQIATMSQGYIADDQALLVAGTFGVGVSIIFGLLACFQYSSLMKATEAAQEAADCIMTMPTLLAEPVLSLILKVPFIVGGVVLILVLVTSGDYQSVDLTKPSSLFNPDDLALTSAVYATFMFLWLMELLHYISVFVVVYTAETWYFKHYGTSRTNFCGTCGPAVMLQAYCAAVTSHLGSLIFASFLMVTLRIVRWIVKAFLSAQEGLSTNPVTSCIAEALSIFTAACLACVQRILDLTSQVALMDIAYHGDSGFCGATQHALEVIFSNRSAWLAVEGVCFVFIAVGIAGIGAGTCVLTYMITVSVTRYTDVESPNHVSDPREVAIVAGVIGVFLGWTMLHPFITIADTMAYCHGFTAYEEKMSAQADVEEATYQNCYGCWTKPARETDLLKTHKKEAQE